MDIVDKIVIAMIDIANIVTTMLFVILMVVAKIIIYDTSQPIQYGQLFYVFFDLLTFLFF